MSMRNLLDEMMQGIAEMAAQREGRITPPEGSHDSWFRAKVQEAMSSAQPKLAHEEAVAKVRAELAKRRKARAHRPLV